MRRFALIPAYKPNENLIYFVQSIEARGIEVVVVNDGSGEEYLPLFSQLEKNSRAKVIHFYVNQGKGAALKEGLSYLNKIEDDFVVITLDADGQHSLKDALYLLDKSMESEDTLILGSREQSKDSPLRSRIGNYITKKIFSISTGVNIEDTQTGMRAFHKSLIPYLLQIKGERYEYEMNMLLEASKQYPILEAPIETVYINDNQASHFRPIRDGLMIYKNILKFALSSLSSFIVDYLVYVFSILFLSFIPSGLHLLLSNGLARVTSSIFNFSTNKKLVFKNKASNLKTGAGYLTLSVVLFFLDTLLISLFNTGFGVNLLIAKILVGIMLFILSWTVQTRFIFKERTCYPV